MKIEKIKDAAQRVQELEEVQEAIKKIGGLTKLREISFEKTYGPFDNGRNMNDVSIPVSLGPIIHQKILETLKEYEVKFKDSIEKFDLN